MERDIFDQNRLKETVDKAIDKFWEEIVKGYPEIGTGDLSPLSLIKFEESCRSVVFNWLQTNG